MKAIVVMFDSLNRRYLPPYGNVGVHTPNFTRLAERSVTFDGCYAGSMPCAPARRELHTGRYNFLHRSWGPLEPFDDSMPEILDQHGVHTHLATDHMHYWEDGGATYHPRYTTCELVRGQQGDPWKGRVGTQDFEPNLRVERNRPWRQDQINRQYMPDVSDHPQTRTFVNGIEFIQRNCLQDNWLVQIETFDPHEPFFSSKAHHDMYPEEYDGLEYDWPDYQQVLEDSATVAHVRNRYAALLSMCDESLGQVLDQMDELNLWSDTLLIVCTDHGLLLGEHSWWGKSAPPWYEETIHTPLFVWDPRYGVAGERRTSLVQTIDIAPTVLDFFGIEPTADMQGCQLGPVLTADTPVREYALFGSFGGHVNVTDGRHVYMRAPARVSNTPLYEHTLMPTHMRGFFSNAELAELELAGPFDFTKDLRVLRTPGYAMTNPHVFGTLLFDLRTDPGQKVSLVDDDVELRMIQAMVDLMRSTDAPGSQYRRMGLPEEGPVDNSHLLAQAQHAEASRGAEPPPPESQFPSGPRSVHSPLAELLADESATAVLARHAPWVVLGPLGQIAGDITLYRAAAFAIGLLPWDTVNNIAVDLARLAAPRACAD